MSAYDQWRATDTAAESGSEYETQPADECPCATRDGEMCERCDPAAHTRAVDMAIAQVRDWTAAYASAVRAYDNSEGSGRGEWARMETAADSLADARAKLRQLRAVKR